MILSRMYYFIFIVFCVWDNMCDENVFLFYIYHYCWAVTDLGKCEVLSVCFMSCSYDCDNVCSYDCDKLCCILWVPMVFFVAVVVVLMMGLVLLSVTRWSLLWV